MNLVAHAKAELRQKVLVYSVGNQIRPHDGRNRTIRHAGKQTDKPVPPTGHHRHPRVNGKEILQSCDLQIVTACGIKERGQKPWTHRLHPMSR